MTTPQEAMRKALECIENSTEFKLGHPAFEQAQADLAALQQAAQEPQPVCEVIDNGYGNPLVATLTGEFPPIGTKLYAAAPAKPAEQAKRIASLEATVARENKAKMAWKRTASEKDEEIINLRAQLSTAHREAFEQLRAEIKNQWEHGFEIWAAIDRAIRALQPEAAQGDERKDAERYRVLRDPAYQMHEDDPCVTDSCFNTFFEEDLDKAVDALKERRDRALAEKGERHE